MVCDDLLLIGYIKDITHTYNICNFTFVHVYNFYYLFVYFTMKYYYKIAIYKENKFCKNNCD